MALITAAELAEHLSCARPTVYAMVHDGRITPHRVGREYRFELEAVLDELKAPPRPWQQSNRSLARKRAT